MQHFFFKEDNLENWKSYPIRLEVPELSDCCHQPRLLVQSMEGGFVTANCSECGRKKTLSRHEFQELPVWVSCPKCRKKMLAQVVPGSSGKKLNYGFACNDCELYIWLSDLLPHWSDVV